MIVIENWKKAVIITFYTVLAVIGFAAIMTAVVAMFMVLDLGEREYISAFIGLAGAIIGGLITLVGVYLTIRHTDKNREKDNLPKKIYRLEKAADILKKVHRDLHEYEGSKNRFLLDFDKVKLSVQITDKYTYLSQDIFVELREELVFVDSNSYKKMLVTKNYVNETGFLITRLKNSLADLREWAYQKYEHNIYDRYHNDDIEIIKEKVAHVNSIEKQITKQIKNEFLSLSDNLRHTHEKLIKEID
ncbi:hypothetical protein CHH58_16090 [Terribacillus saccharophilus]|uniref:hypothetical protein n=1 Tax=Terribacillus saccharophilus TaxID=361277 RepID=UPI000BA5D1C4|nr:hypothetical protein [Terribacillus saccharophilus]PAF35574.1 hypothetical protein CHH58_16090 [Terribacillus saccharophilus]